MKFRSEFKHGFYLSRNIRPAVFSKKGVLKIFAKFKRKHLYESLSFNKVAGLRSATLLKKRLLYRCFPVNFAKFLRTTFLTEHLRRLLQNKLYKNDVTNIIRCWREFVNIIRHNAYYLLATKTVILCDSDG